MDEQKKSLFALSAAGTLPLYSATLLCHSTLPLYSDLFQPACNRLILAGCHEIFRRTSGMSCCHMHSLKESLSSMSTCVSTKRQKAHFPSLPQNRERADVCGYIRAHRGFRHLRSACHMTRMVHACHTSSSRECSHCTSPFTNIAIFQIVVDQTTWVEITVPSQTGQFPGIVPFAQDLSEVDP
jgi:hypothetical protein